RRHQPDRPGLSLAIEQQSREYPILVLHLREVFLLDPVRGLFPVTPATPAPHHAEDTRIHIREGALARRKAVVHGPTLDLLIQSPEQLSRRHAARAFDRFPYLRQKRLDSPL